MTDVHASRRAVFAGVGAVGLAGVLAACGGDETPAANSTTNGTSTAKPSAATTTGAPVQGFSAKTSDIPVGGGKIFGEDEVVITQPTAGTFVGLNAICTHQQCILAKVENGRIKCGCHGSEFAIADGKVLNGPARQALSKKNLKVEGGTITLA